LSQFAFYRGTDRSLAARLKESCRKQWGEVKEAAREGFRLYVPAADTEFILTESADLLGAVTGYVRHDSEGHRPDAFHNRRLIETVVHERQWPLPDKWTGSFGAVAYSDTTKELILCNDLIGFMPVYFARRRNDWIGGTSLIVLSSVLRPAVDATGLVQKITPPYANYGRRTLLAGISRLLPGERMACDRGAARSRSTFDDSLCAGMINADIDSTARIVWNCLQKEMTLAVGQDDDIGVAMSGGWDSRIVLAGIAHRQKTVECLTYGDPDAYEPAIARRCAEAVGARHSCFPIQDHYFPPADAFQALARETESFTIPEWFSIIHARKGSKGGKKILLLGDHAQSIDARYMTTLSSRTARRKSFANSLLGRVDPLTAATDAQFEQWKRTRIDQICEDLRKGFARLSPAVALQSGTERVVEESAADIALSAERVRGNRPPFVEMFDELFIWFHKTRFTLASQNLLLTCAFRPMSPTMSMRSLRLLSTVHPQLRLRRRLMDALARLPEFDRLGTIPSAQIPLLSARAPAMVRELAWGLRSGVDQVLIKRVMKSKDPGKRHRVLKSLDYIKEYRREYAVPRVRAWFSGKWVQGEPFARMALERGELSSWPLINLDITAPANVSMVLDACRTGSGR
jgi:hypothetical protein